MHGPTKESQQWIQRVQCITFATPMVGDQKVSRSIEQPGWDALFHHIVYEDDPVPKLLALSTNLRAALEGALSKDSELGAALDQLDKSLEATLTQITSWMMDITIGALAGTPGVGGAVAAVLSAAKPVLTGASKSLYAALKKLLIRRYEMEYQPFGKYYVIPREKEELARRWLEPVDTFRRNAHVELGDKWLASLLREGEQGEPGQKGLEDLIWDHLMVKYSERFNTAEFSLPTPGTSPLEARQELAEASFPSGRAGVLGHPEWISLTALEPRSCRITVLPDQSLAVSVEVPNAGFVEVLQLRVGDTDLLPQGTAPRVLFFSSCQ